MKRLFDLIDEVADETKDLLSALNRPGLINTAQCDGYKVRIETGESEPKVKINPEIQFMEDLRSKLDWSKMEQPLHFYMENGKTVWMNSQTIVWGKS